MADNLGRKVKQHLVNRDSSVTTGTSAAGLNPDHTRAVQWWADGGFSDRTTLTAAELVAFDALHERPAAEQFPQAAYSKWLDQTSDREAARSDRIHGAVGVIPTPLWRPGLKVVSGEPPRVTRKRD